MENWLNLPQGFADIKEADLWQASLNQAQKTIQRLIRIRCALLVEEWSQSFPEVCQLVIDHSRQTSGVELSATIFLPELGPLGSESFLEPAAIHGNPRANQALARLRQVSQVWLECIDSWADTELTPLRIVRPVLFRAPITAAAILEAAQDHQGAAGLESARLRQASRDGPRKGHTNL